MPAFKDPVTGASYQVSDDEAGQLSPAPAPQQVGIPFSDPVSGDQYHITPDEAAMLSQVAPKDPMGSMGGTAPGPTDDVDHPIARGLGYGGASLTEILPLALAGVARLPDLAAQGIENIAPKKLADWLKSVHAETAAEDAVFKYGVDPLEHAKEALQPKANEDWGFWKKVEFGAGAAVPTLLSLYATKGASAPESLGPLAGFLLHGSAAGLQMAVPQTASEAATQAAQGDKGSDIAKSAAKNFAINYAMGLVPGSVPEAWLAKAFPASTAARAAARAGSGAVLGAGIQGGSDVLSGQEVDPADITLGALLGGGVSVLHPMLSGDGMKAGEAEGVMAAAAQAKEAGLDAETIAAIMGKNRGDAAATIAELNTHANAAQATQPAPAPDEFVDSQEAAERVGTPMDREILMARQAGVPDAMIRHVLEGFPGRDIAAIRAVRSLREAVSESFQGSPEGEIQVGEAELPPTQELAGTPEEAFQDALAEHAQAPTTDGIEVQEHPGNIQEMTSGQEAPTVNDGLPDEPSTKGIKVEEIPGQEVGAVPGTEIPEAAAAQAAEAENLQRFAVNVPHGTSEALKDRFSMYHTLSAKGARQQADHFDNLAANAGANRARKENAKRTAGELREYADLSDKHEGGKPFYKGPMMVDKPLAPQSDLDGLRGWLRDYIATRKAGNVKLAKELKNKIFGRAKELGITDEKLRIFFNDNLGDPDAESVKERYGQAAPKFDFHTSFPEASAEALDKLDTASPPGMSLEERTKLAHSEMVDAIQFARARIQQGREVSESGIDPETGKLAEPKKMKALKKGYAESIPKFQAYYDKDMREYREAFGDQAADAFQKHVEAMPVDRDQMYSPMTSREDRRAERRGAGAQVFDADEREKHIAHLTAENEKLRNLTLQDPATGMRNRRAFDEDAKLGWPAVISTDVDSLKWVNDNLGHANGDRLVKAIAGIHGQHEADNVRAYRTGGDEFGLRANMSQAEAEALGKKLQEHAEKARLTLTGNDPTTGEKRTFQYDGLGLTYGVGHHADEITRTTTADARLNRSKLEREATGERAARGEPPATLVREPAQAEQPAPDSGRAEAVTEPAPKPARAARKTPARDTPNADLQDVGEKIGGARKDTWQSRGLTAADLEGMSGGEESKYITKQNIWKPDYAAMIKGGAEPKAAAMVKLIYDRLGAKPDSDTPQGRRDYLDMMGHVRDVLNDVKTEADVRKAESTIHERIGYTGRSYSDPARGKLVSVYKGRHSPLRVGYGDDSKAEKLVGTGFPNAEAWTRRLEVRSVVTPGDTGLTPEGAKYYADLARKTGATGDDLEEQVRTKGMFIVQKRGDHADKNRRYVIGDRAAAEAAARQRYEESKTGKGADEGGLLPIRPHLDQLKRTGADIRAGKDISAEDFRQQFGFRGVEFGNWAASDERQKHVNQAFDALHDLSNTLGLPPEAMSLNGTLGLAFGARGNGRGLAHYEPTKLAINITKVNGPGSLAHEWGHALDHYFGELDRPDAMQGKARGASGWYNQPRLEDRNATQRMENLRPEMVQAFNGVLKAIYRTDIGKAEAVRNQELRLEKWQEQVDRGTAQLAKAKEDGDKSNERYTQDWMTRYGQPELARIQKKLAELRDQPEPPGGYGAVDSSYFQDAQKLSGQAAAKGYWARPTELFARAFESYVHDKITQKGNQSDYLVHGVEGDRYSKEKGYKGNPYPFGLEREKIDGAFDKLFDTMETKQTDKGTALYSLGGDDQKAETTKEVGRIYDHNGQEYQPEKDGYSNAVTRQGHPLTSDEADALRGMNGTFRFATQGAETTGHQGWFLDTSHLAYGDLNNAQRVIVGRASKRESVGFGVEHGLNNSVTWHKVLKAGTEPTPRTPDDQPLFSRGNVAQQGLAEGQPQLDTGKAPVFARTEGDSLLRSDQGASPFRGDRPEAYVSPRVAEGAVSGMDVGRMFPGTDRIRSHDDVERMLEPLPDSKDRAGIVIADDLNRPIAVLHHGVDDAVFQLQDAISQMDGAARFWTTENQNPELIQALQDSLGMEHQPDGTVADPSDRSDVMEEIGAQLPQGVHVDDLRQAVETVLKKYNPGPNSPRVQSVQDISEVPARLARDAMASRTDHLVQAIYDPVDDKIWAVGNGFESADDVEAKLFHESLHMGLRRYFGTELDPFLKRVGFTYGKAGLVDIARKYGLDLNTDYGMRVAAEEKLAQLAETMEKPDLWSSFVTFAKQWLNRRGFGFELNERDLRNTVASIANRTLKGDLPAVPFRSDNRIRYSMRPAQMDADLKAISDRVMAPPEDSKTLGQTIREKLLRIKNTDMTSVKQGLLDGAAGLEKLERGLTGGELLDANSSAYKSYYATKNLASVMGHVMVQGVPEYRDGTFQPVAGRKGMVDIFRPIVEHKDGNLLRQWELYAAANRAKRLITEKNPDGTSREKLFTQADIDKVMQLGKKYPEFQKAVDDYQEFNRQLLDLVQDRGVLNGDERKMWERNDYVPMYRAMDDMAQGAGQGPKNKRGVSGQRSGIRRLEGSEEKMGSVLENITLNTAHLLDAAYKNEAMRRIVDLGDGVALHKVNMAWKPTDISHAQMIQALNEAGMEVKHFTPELEKQWATVFRRVAPVGPNIVSVMREGKPDYYEASDPLLYRTITSMGAQQHGTLMNIFRFSKHMLTASITADPGFMVRNFLRDTVNTLLVSDAKIKPLSDAIKNFGAAMKNDPDLLRMMAAGYGGGGFYDTNPKQARKILDRALGEKKGGGIIGKVTSPKQLWWAYQRIGNASEMANRLSVYKAVVANGGTHAEAAYQANDLLNFAKTGDYGAMQFITQTVPFLNARIQGTYKVVQGARAHPLGFALKAATMIGATMALAAYNQQKPEYEDLPDYDKDTYWHFYVGGDHFRIPKPFEIGAMFGTVPERMMRVMEGRDDSRELAQRMAFMVASTFSLNPVPQALNPLLMQYANRNGFGGTPIVPYSMTDVDPKAQYTAATSPTMRTVAGVMPDAAPEWLQSPVRLQAALEAYTGTLGGYALGVADMATREIGGFPVAPSRRLDEEPIVSSFVRDPVMHNTHSLEAFYDALEQSNEAYGAMMKYQKEANLEAAQSELKDHPTAIAVHSALTSLERDIAALDNQMRMVYANTSMTGDQKKASLDQLTLSRNAIASQAMVYTQALSEHP